ncbi:MAG: cobyric acid synthase [Luteitalea sp.]|nr:cobyric acid synthase [Luteitalea sp.]
MDTRKKLRVPSCPRDESCFGESKKRHGSDVTARTLFIGGTSSNAGKSWMATAICAWLRRKGVSVAPFKAQNMSNNSYPCQAGGEIGRAQVAQAEACGLEPEPAMNPILLKPSGAGTSQVVVNGRVWKTLSARDYYAHADQLRETVLEAYANLSRRFDAIVIEGAGSVTELNLRHHDLVNLGLVTRIRAPWLLVADIERGGVFGSVIGTTHLLSPDERALFQGFAINKFRGDVSLFDDGVRILEERTASRCFGVFPYADDIVLDAEDSLALKTRPTTPAPPGARLAIAHFPHLSNATDFRLLTWADWITSPPDGRYDFIILPGTKSTIADLAWLRGVGLADWIVEQYRGGATVVGICGGYQMLGRTIHDPGRMESAIAEAKGLGLVEAVTVLARDKRTEVVSAMTPGGIRFGGYQIHLGVTTLDRRERVVPFARLVSRGEGGDGGIADGVRAPRVVGTYLHGAFEHADVCAEIFGIDLPSPDSKAGQYHRLASWFEEHGRNLGQLGLD